MGRDVRRRARDWRARRDPRRRDDAGELVVDPVAETDVQEKIDRIYTEEPDLDFELRAEWYASMPAAATPIPNPEGLAPGCVAENVYVLPGIPEEMKAVFGNIAGDFAGDVVTRTLYSPEPEGALASPLGELTDRFAVRVGSYPNRSADRTRITVTGNNDTTVGKAVSWLRERTDVALESVAEGGADGSGPVDSPAGADGSGPVDSPADPN